MKIELGGGRRPKGKGYLNIDLGNADINCDIQEGLPFDDNSLDRIYTHHCLEHLWEHKILFVFDECYRVLKPGKVLEIFVPDFDDAYSRFKRFENGESNGEWFGMIFGSDSDDYQDLHRTIFTEKKLRNQLEEAQFSVGKFDYPIWYGRNLHVIARKP